MECGLGVYFKSYEVLFIGTAIEFIMYYIVNAVDPDNLLHWSAIVSKIYLRLYEKERLVLHSTSMSVSSAVCKRVTNLEEIFSEKIPV